MSVAISRGAPVACSTPLPAAWIRITPRASEGQAAPYEIGGRRSVQVEPPRPVRRGEGGGRRPRRPDCLHPYRKAVVRPVQRERHRGSPVRFATAVNGVKSVFRRSCSIAPLTPSSCQPIGTGERERRGEDDVRVLPERDDAPRRRVRGARRSRSPPPMSGAPTRRGHDSGGVRLGIDGKERGADLPDHDESVEQPSPAPRRSRSEGLVAESLEKRRRGLERRMQSA